MSWHEPVKCEECLYYHNTRGCDYDLAYTSNCSFFMRKLSVIKLQELIMDLKERVERLEHK